MTDTAANLLASSNATGIAKATTVSLSGTANTVTTAQANALIAMHGFALASGATLTVADTAANLLASGNAAGIAKATAVTLTGTANPVTAAQATTLAARSGFSVASVLRWWCPTTLANLLASWQCRRACQGDQRDAERDQHGHRAQAATLATLHGFGLAAGATCWYPIPPPTCSPTRPGPPRRPAVSLTGTTNSVTATQATTLASLRGFALASGATLLVSDSAANLLANAPALAKATGVSLTGTANTVTAAQATIAGCAGWVRAGLRCDAERDG